MSKPMIVCSCCNGKGKTELTGVYRDAFDLLSLVGSEIHGAALAKLANCKPTAMNNRLAALLNHGLVQSRKHGRKTMYCVKGAKRG